MKKLLFLAVTVIIGLTACQKQTQTLTQVGFYVIDPTYTISHNDGYLYDLYIDSKYEGPLQVSNSESTDSTIMNFKLLDSKKHIIEVKAQNTLVSSTYLQIEEEKVASGTAGIIQSNKPNGAYYKHLVNYNYSCYGIYQ